MHYRLKADSTTAVGIDGCRGGWIAAICRPDGSMGWRLEAELAAILKELPKTRTILVDMIIGLPDCETPYRECDRLARKLLRPHGSRVFPAPPREALAAATYPEACSLARAATGKAISKQCWHLFPKIRELDRVSDHRILESHPELVFARFNDGQPVAASKKTIPGQHARLRLLRTAMPQSLDAYLESDLQLAGADYLPDDLIDALALCAAARRAKALKRLPIDGKGPAIWY